MLASINVVVESLTKAKVGLKLENGSVIELPNQNLGTLVVGESLVLSIMPARQASLNRQELSKEIIRELLSE